MGRGGCILKALAREPFAIWVKVGSNISDFGGAIERKEMGASKSRSKEGIKLPLYSHLYRFGQIFIRAEGHSEKHRIFITQSISHIRGGDQ